MSWAQDREHGHCSLKDSRISVPHPAAEALCAPALHGKQQTQQFSGCLPPHPSCSPLGSQEARAGSQTKDTPTCTHTLKGLPTQHTAWPQVPGESRKIWGGPSCNGSGQYPKQEQGHSSAHHSLCHQTTLPGISAKCLPQPEQARCPEVRRGQNLSQLEGLCVQTWAQRLGSKAPDFLPSREEGAAGWGFPRTAATTPAPSLSMVLS